MGVMNLMKFKSTILLAVIFVGLILYVYFYEIVGGRKRSAEEEEKNKVFHFKRDEIEKVIVNRPDITMTFRKKEKEWWIETPVKYKGNELNINSLLSQIEIAENEGTVSETGEDAQNFGLAPNPLKLYFVLKNGEKDSVQIGTKNPIGNAVFARKDNNSEIFLTNYMILTNMEKDLIDFRDLKLLEIDKNDINRIVLTYPNQTIDLKKTGFKEWEIQKPIKFSADLTAITNILNTFDEAKIKRFIDEHPENLRDYGISKPAVKFEMFFERDASKKTLLVGSKIKEHDIQKDEDKDLYYAKNEVYDPVIGIESSIVNALNTNLFDFRNKMVVYYKREDIEKIVLDYKDSMFVCIKDSTNDWFLGEDRSVPADKGKIEDIITKFRSIRALEFIDYNENKLSQFGLAKPQMEFVFKGRNDDIIESLAFGKIKGDRIYLLNKTKKIIFLVGTDSLYELKFKKSELIENNENTNV